jgi:hypothetical protein
LCLVETRILRLQVVGWETPFQASEVPGGLLRGWAYSVQSAAFPSRACRRLERYQRSESMVLRGPYSPGKLMAHPEPYTTALGESTRSKWVGRRPRNVVGLPLAASAATDLKVCGCEVMTVEKLHTCETSGQVCNHKAMIRTSRSIGFLGGAGSPSKSTSSSSLSSLSGSGSAGSSPGSVASTASSPSTEDERPSKTFRMDVRASPVFFPFRKPSFALSMAH